MDDGVRLYGWASRYPPQGPRPVLLFLTPYRNNACPTETTHAYAAQDGYLSPEITRRMAFLNVSMRGTGSSEGTFEHLGPRTQQDIRAVTAWAAQQPWSNGSIVVMGHSGTGFQDVFTLTDPHVMAVFARSTCFDTYRGCFRPGGMDNAVSDVYASVLTAGYVQGLPARLRLGLDRNPSIPEQLAAIDQVVTEFKSRDVYDDWWQSRSGLGLAAQTQVPVFYGTDVFDILPSSSYLAYERTPGARLTLGWGHTAETTLLTAARARELLISPLDRFVLRYGFGEDNGIEREPRVQLVTTLGEASGFIAGRVLVRGEDDWPLPGTAWARLYLDAGRTGSAASLNDGALALLPPQSGGSDTTLLASTPSLSASFRTAFSALGHGHEGFGAPQAVAPLSNLRAA
ncbi:MAG: CocE/NonD family hydrolase, partial [Nevskiales bacterium]